MGKVIFDISMSLDGFMTAANRRPEEPMGDGGLFVVTHEAPADSPEGGVYTFVTDGTRMFEGRGAGQIQLEPIDVIDTPAATHLRFRVVK
jgi:hypothetical protein